MQNLISLNLSPQDLADLDAALATRHSELCGPHVGL